LLVRSAGTFPVKGCFAVLNMGGLHVFVDSKTLCKPRIWDIFIVYLAQRVVTSLYSAERVWDDRKISAKISLFRRLHSEVFLVDLFVCIAVINLVMHIWKFM